MEKIANRLILKTNTEYKITNTDEYFVIQKSGENEPILGTVNAPFNWEYIYQNAENIKEIGLVAFSEDPDYYPDGYMNIGYTDEYFIDSNGMIMIKDQWELEDSDVRKWINEKSEEIEIFGQFVTIDADMAESMGIFDEISEYVYELCSENSCPEIVEFFDYTDDKVMEWMKKADQVPQYVAIRNDNTAVILDNDLSQKTNSLTELVYYFMNKTLDEQYVTYSEIFNGIMAILSEKD